MKEKIIASSIELFNQFGINQTSFRDIASLMKISDGHVRYYFKTKEGLLLAIFNQMDKEILHLTTHPTDGIPNTKLLLKGKLTEIFTIMVNYSFFFEESPKTLTQFPELVGVYKDLINNRKILFLEIFRELATQGFFKATFTPKVQETVFYSIFIISDSWIRYYTILNNKKPDKKAIEFHSDVAFSILLPYID